MESTKPLISVAVYLKGSDLDPTVVSKMLGLEPSRSQRKGGYKHRSTKFIAKIGTWALEISSDSRPVEEMIEELLAKLDMPGVSLDKIQGVEDAYIDIFIAWDDGPNETVEFRLTNHQIARIRQLGLATCFTVSKPD